MVSESSYKIYQNVNKVAKLLLREISLPNASLATLSICAVLFGKIASGLLRKEIRSDLFHILGPLRGSDPLSPPGRGAYLPACQLSFILPSSV